MTLEQLESRYCNFYAPGFAVEVDGQDLMRAGAQITAVSVDNDLAGADQFSFTINNPYNPSRGSFEWLDNQVIANDKKVEIKMGYGDRMESLILGIITSVKASFATNGGSQLQVSGYDLSYLMMKGKRSRSWNNQKDSDVVTDVAKAYGFFAVDARDSTVVFPQTRQDKESDFDFVKKLAERNGFEFSVAGNDLSFVPPPPRPDPIATLHYGKTLASFSPELTTTDQVSEVRVMGWDAAAKQEIIGSAKAPNVSTAGAAVEEVRKPVYSRAEADTLAAAILAGILRGRVRGNGESLGLPLLRPSLGIELQGLGTLFSKTYYLEKTTHTIGTSGYKTTFMVREAGV